MLGKLIKHEFRNSARQMAALLAVLAVLTVFGFAAGNTISYANRNNLDVSAVSVLIEVVFMLSVFAIYIIVFVNQCESYYKTMYSLRGYLTHTLPATELELLVSKLIVSFLWILAATVVCSFAGLLVINSMSGGDFFAAMSRAEWRFMAQMLYKHTGISVATIIFLVVMYFTVGVLTALLFFFFCMAVGQLSTKNRKAVSIFTGIGVQCLLLFISTFVSRLFVERITDLQISLQITEETFTTFLSVMLWSFLGMTFVVGVLLFLGCWLINRKHLNLE